MTLSSQTEPLFLRVTKKPRINRKKLVFFAVEVDTERWSKVDYKTHYIIEICDTDFDAYQEELDVGAICRIVPDTMLHKNVKINNLKYNRKIVTTSNFTLVRSKGSLIIKLIGNSNKFKGIGELKAKRLWERFGEGLYDILDNKNVEELTSNFEGRLTTKTATNLVNAWESYLNTDVILFCNKLKLSVSQSIRLAQFYKEATKQKIEEDPYRLLAFNIPFIKCDEIATKQFGMAFDDAKRLSAAVEEGLYRVLDSGSVVADYETLFQKVSEFIPEDKLVSLALSGEYINNNYVLLNDGKYQSNGSFVMEAYLTDRIKAMLNTKPKLNLPKASLNKVISKYEKRNNFNLTIDQKQAVSSVLNNNLCLINGGAGVGKTSVLDCIYDVFDECGIIPVQVALAGKAAKRMSELTGRESYTIARFIRRANKLSISPKKFALVIDEGSMVDLFSMYQLLHILPQDAKLIILGDSGQLHPVGYGLVLHELLKVPQIPKITLKEVKRQGKHSNIPHVSQEIGKGLVPTFNDQDVKFVKSNVRKTVLKDILELYQEDALNTQIICATNKMVDLVNNQCGSLNESKKLLVYNDYHDSFETTGFRFADKVMCTQNLYDLDVMNGTVGKVVECYNLPTAKEIDIVVNGQHQTIFSLGKIKWDDGITTEISDDLLNNLSLAYAMTIHKSQGSQFPIVIIPVFQAPNMDRTMLYTALTRAQKKVVLVGSKKVLVNSINMIHSDERKADLANKLLEILK